MFFAITSLRDAQAHERSDIVRLFPTIVMSAIAAIFILSLLGCGYMEYGLPWKHGQVKEQIHAHLEETYKETFELGAIRFDLLHGGNYYTYTTSDQTDVTFYVETSDTSVTDAYSYAYWQKEGDRFILPPIREYYKQLTSGSLTLHVEMLQRIEGTADQEKLKEHVLWHISFQLPYEITMDNSTIEIEKAYNTLQALKKDNIRVASCTIYFNNRIIHIPEGKMDRVTSVQDLEQYVTIPEEIQ